MADTKLSWTELRRALAVRAGVSDKEANTFLNALNEQLIAALKSDKQVRVNGLGTFKLQAVAPRKSVNVTTGEEIIIEGYNKIAFVPEAGVKELVEKGEVRSETDNAPEFVDPLKKLGAQAEEIVGLLGELGQEVKKGTKDKVQGTKKGTKDKVQGTKDKVQSTKEEPVVVAEPEPIVAPEPEPVVEEPEQVQSDNVQSTKKGTKDKVQSTKEEPEKPKKKYHFMRDTLICVVVLLMLLFAGYFFLRSQLSGWINELVNPTESIQTSEVSIQPSEEPTAVSIQPAEEPMKVTEPVEEEWSFDEILLTEEITEGSRLAWIAKKHYGDKAYWPYIYAANKDQLSNPSIIPVGTPIRVPKLNAAMRDTTDVRFQRLKEEAIEAIN